MAVTASDQWWAALEKSNLLTAEQFAQSRAQAAQANLADAKSHAEWMVKRGLITRWQAEQLLSGRTSLYLGRYLLEKRIGKGGMGAVYKARHTVMGRSVALKVMSPTLLSDANAVARFRREVEAAAKLNHTNIVSAYDADCVGKTHFLVMEYIDGPDLKQWFTTHAPLSIPWVCECIRQAAVGLQHAHEHGMVHRDLKPNNLLVTTDKPNGLPVVKILDMGLARFVSSVKDDDGLTQSGQIMGTPDYIAPEQAEDTKRADIRSDIFSLGCTLFYLLTGELPFRGESIMAKLMARVQNTAPLIRTLRTDVPAGLESLIAKMLSANPDHRPQTPGEVATALAPYASGMDAGTAETISMPTPSEIPTVTAGGRPESDAGLGDFLANLASQPAHLGRLKLSQSRPDDSSGNFQGESSGSSIVTGQRVPKLAYIVVAIISMLLIGALAAVVMNNANSDTVAEAPSEFQGGNPVPSDEPVPEEPSTTPAAEATKPATDAPPKPPRMDASASAKALEEATSKLGQPDTQKSSDGSAPAAGDKSPMPPPTDPATPNATPPVKKPAVPRAPQVHVVGVATGEIPDLQIAFEKAGPGDTILIRHRGPLDFEPVDLTDKTPLTIVGDTDPSGGGANYWPVLRQINVDPNALPTLPAAKGLFHGPSLEMVLRKVHLLAAGPDRLGIGAVFACGSGRIEVDQCTVTVGVQSYPGEAAVGSPIPLVRLAAESNGALGLVLKNSFLRGQRLQGSVVAEGAAQLNLQAAEVIWAGGAAPWLDCRDPHGPVKVGLKNCTVYNTPTFLAWESHDENASTQATVDIQTEKCLFVAPFANAEPFLAWNPGDPKSDLTGAVAAGRMRWNGTSNIFHRYASYYNGPDPQRPQGLDDWRKLWNQDTTAMARQADPMFRVWPDGYELQESQARDYQARFSRARTRGPSIEAGIGADPNQVPQSLFNLVRLRPVHPDVAGKPRRVPRVLRVHHKDGPFKTLEAAVAAAQDEDVIEIESDGPFVPVRDFGQPQSGLASADTAVIPVSVPNLTIRAAESVHPVVILDERQQRAVGTRSLLLFYVSGAESFSVEGIHFHLIQPKDRTGGIAYQQENQLSRWINCGFTQAIDGHQDGFNWVGHETRFQCVHSTSVLWLENNSYNSNFGEYCNAGAQGPGWMLARNCLSVGHFLACTTYAEREKVTDLVLANCSVFGQALAIKLDHESRFASVRSTRNLVVQTGAGTFATLEPSAGMPRVSVSGADNVIAWSNRPVPDAERNAGTNTIFPGPNLTTSPVPEGTSTARDVYRPFRLKKGQPAATMAGDGGPVGVRFEYLPEIPQQLPAILQGR